MKTPEDVVAAAFAAINTEDWHGLTMLCDPVSLLIFKKQTLRMLSHYAESCDLEDDFDDDCLGFADMLRYELANTSSIEEAAEMDPGRVFVRWVQARSCSHYDNDEDESWQKASAGSGRRTVRSYKYSVLGSVMDPPDLAHVLYRPTASPTESRPEGYAKYLNEMPQVERQFAESMFDRGDPNVVTCRKQSDESWKLIAKRNFFLFDSLDVVDVKNGAP